MIRRLHPTRRFATGLALALLVAGCAEVDGTPAEAGAVLVVAASSTSEVVTILAERYTAATGVSVRVSTGASNTLAAQVMAGVPADVFISANPRWGDELAAAGLVADAAPLMSNRLVIAVPRGNPGGITAPSDLVGARVSRVALAGEAVPVGTYARQALADAGVVERLERDRRIVRGQNARSVLAYVESGEVDAGLVYSTDARISDGVEVAYTFAATASEPIAYELVLLRDAPHGRAPDLFRFLRSREAAAVLATHGFTTIEDAS